MTEIATYEAPSAPAATFAGAASIEATARALVDAHKIGTALCRTAFVPKHFQGKPDDAAAAILYGSTINMDPVTALQNVYVIGGKPALYARTMAAIVMSHGHQMWTEEESEGRVTVAGRRNGSDKVERVTWTSEMAQRAGYTSNAKYKSDPRSMLYARASGDVARRIAPDALLGMAHNVEELTVAGEVAEPQRPAQAPAPDRMRAALGEQPQRMHEPAEEPAEPEAPAVEPDSQESPLLNTSSKLAKAMYAAINEAGIAEDQRIAFLGATIGREIGSSKEMTEGEARTVLDALAALRADEPVDAELIEDPA